MKSSSSNQRGSAESHQHRDNSNNSLEKERVLPDLFIRAQDSTPGLAHDRVLPTPSLTPLSSSAGSSPGSLPIVGSNIPMGRFDEGLQPAAWPLPPSQVSHQLMSSMQVTHVSIRVEHQAPEVCPISPARRRPQESGRHGEDDASVRPPEMFPEGYRPSPGGGPIKPVRREVAPLIRPEDVLRIQEYLRSSWPNHGELATSAQTLTGASGQNHMLGAWNVHRMDRAVRAPHGRRDTEPPVPHEPQPGGILPQPGRILPNPYNLTAPAAVFHRWRAELLEDRLPTSGSLALLGGDPSTRWVRDNRTNTTANRRSMSGVSSVAEHLSRAWCSEEPNHRRYVSLDASNPRRLLESYRNQIEAIRRSSRLAPPRQETGSFFVQDNAQVPNRGLLSRMADQLLDLLESCDMDYMVVWLDIQDEMPLTEQNPHAWAASWFFSDSERWRNSRGRFLLTSSSLNLLGRYMGGHAQSRLRPMEIMMLTPG